MPFRFMLAGLAAFLVAAAPPPADDFPPERFRAHVRFLADDLLEGRESGTRGYDLAAHYVATRFEALGLTPPVDGGWYQQVPFIRFGMTDTPATLAVGGRRFVHGEEVLIRQSPAAGRLSLEAPVLFAGYGISDAAAGIDDYRGLDARGRVVAVLSGFPADLPSDVGAHLSSEKRRMAEERGAVGLLIIRTPQDMERLPWARMTHRAHEPGLTWVNPDGAPYADAPGLRFVATLGEEAAEALFEGARRPLARIFAEARRGRPRGFALGRPVAVERESVNREFSSPNVIALLPGSDPALANEYVILTAHLDGLGIDERIPEGENRIRNGAMDNATGVATLLEVARHMASLPQRPRRPILFAALTAEEKGLLGAQYLARNPVVDGQVVGVVNLDMPILSYDFQDVVAFGAEHSTMGPMVARAAERMGVTLSPDPVPEEGLFTRSDHYMFVREGIPAVFLVTGYAGEGRVRSEEFLAEHYHRPSDDMNLPFDWNAASRFARLNYLIAREMADSEQAPLWYRGSYFGDTFAPNRPKAEPPR